MNVNAAPLVANDARSTIRSKFVLALLSSWVASPLAIAFAQLAGFANAPAIIVALLTLGAIAPIQVLVNEALVPAVVRKRRRLDGISEAALCVLQAATIASVFLHPGAPAVALGDVLIAVVAGAAASFLSTRAATLQVELILSGSLAHRTVMLVSATPGLLTLLVYVLLGAALLAGVEIGFRLVYVTIVLPVFAQVVLLSASRGAPSEETSAARLLTRASGWFFGAAVVLFAAASAAAAVRVGVAARYERVVGLILVALNSTFALSFTFSKILFLEGRRGALLRLGPALVVLAVLTALTVGVTRDADLGLLGMLGVLVALQAAIAAAISATRTHVHEDD